MKDGEKIKMIVYVTDAKKTNYIKILARRHAGIDPLYEGKPIDDIEKMIKENKV